MQSKKKICMQENKPKANTTPTPKLMVHGSAHMKWYFQCSHRCIGWPMLVKAWFTNKTTVQTRKQERYNNEDKHTLSLNVSIEHEWVQVHDMKSMDLSWCCATLHATVKHTHTLDYDVERFGMRKTLWRGECDNIHDGSARVQNRMRGHKL